MRVASRVLIVLALAIVLPAPSTVRQVSASGPSWSDPITYESDKYTSGTLTWKYGPNGGADESQVLARVFSGVGNGGVRVGDCLDVSISGTAFTITVTVRANPEVTEIVNLEDLLECLNTRFIGTSEEFELLMLSWQSFDLVNTAGCFHLNPDLPTCDPVDWGFPYTSFRCINARTTDPSNATIGGRIMFGFYEEGGDVTYGSTTYFDEGMISPLLLVDAQLESTDLSWTYTMTVTTCKDRSGPTFDLSRYLDQQDLPDTL
jgi:hypothetical protein